MFDLFCLCIRLPNPAQICYMNSCLQSLLTLEDFIKSISCQEPVWSTTPNAAVMRYSALNKQPLILSLNCTFSTNKERESV